MTIGVVHRFEVIDVEHRHRHRRSRSPGANDLDFKRFLDAGVLEQAGQAVPRDLGVELAGAFDSGTHGSHQVGVRDRLGEKVVGAAPHRLDLHVEVGLGRQIDNGQAGPALVLAYHPRQLRPRIVGHVHVHQHQLRTQGRGRFDDGLGLMQDLGLHAGSEQRQLVVGGERHVVFDDEHPRWRRAPPVENMRHPIHQTGHVQRLDEVTLRPQSRGARPGGKLIVRRNEQQRATQGTQSGPQAEHFGGVLTLLRKQNVHDQHVGTPGLGSSFGVRDPLEDARVIAEGFELLAQLLAKRLVIFDQPHKGSLTRLRGLIAKRHGGGRRIARVAQGVAQRRQIRGEPVPCLQIHALQLACQPRLDALLQRMGPRAQRSQTEGAA